jgi:transcriptional regulator with XRE-family HTH domain
MLGQLELGKTTPSIHVVWKIAQALGVTLTALVDGILGTRPTVMRASTAERLTSNGGGTTIRSLSCNHGDCALAFYEVNMGPQSFEEVEPHAPGTRENLVVVRGKLGIRICGELHCLSAGDAIEFPADVAHEYRNEGDELLHFYVVRARPPDSPSPAQGGFPHP